jgi:hypothetical protein
VTSGTGGRFRALYRLMSLKRFLAGSLTIRSTVTPDLQLPRSGTPELAPG